MELANVGPLYKLRIRHDNSKSFADWHLEKVLWHYDVLARVVWHSGYSMCSVDLRKHRGFSSVVTLDECPFEELWENSL